MARWIILFSITLTLSGCCGFAGCCGVGLSTRSLAWDGLGPNDPNRPWRRPNPRTNAKQTHTVVASVEQPSDKGAELAALPKNSPEWWALHDEIEAAADTKLAKSLIICRGCLPSNADEQTGSIK
jgi:hypothetical protein